MFVTMTQFRKMQQVLRTLDNPSEVARIRARAFCAPDYFGKALDCLLEPAEGVSSHQIGPFVEGEASSMITVKFMTMAMAFIPTLNLTRKELDDPTYAVEVDFVPMDAESFDVAEALVREEIDRLITLHQLLDELPEANLETALKKVRETRNFPKTQGA